jgi:predicted phosphoribosyltransferase
LRAVSRGLADRPDVIVLALPRGGVPVSLRSPDPFVAVGLWFRDFSETSDAEVRALLGRNEL